MRYGKGVILTLITKGIALPIGIISSVITARYLGPSGRGVLALLVVIQGFALQFGALGFNASITYFISRERTATSAIVMTAAAAGLAAGMVIAVGLGLVAWINPGILLGQVDSRYLFVFLIAIPFSFLHQLLQNVFIARQAIVEFNLLDLTVRVLQLFAYAFVLVYLGLSTYEAVLALVAVTVVAGLLYLLRSLRYVHRPVSFDRARFGAMIRYGLRTYIAGLFMFLAIRVNLFLINLLLGEHDSGVYSVALQISDLVYLIPTTLGLMLFPKVSEDEAGSVQLTVKAFRSTFILMVTVAVGIVLVGQPLIVLLYGEKFLGAVGPLYALTPGIVFLSLVMILNNDLAGRGLPAVVIIAPAVGAIVNASLNLLLLHTWGILASAVSSSVAHFVMLLILLGWFMRRVRVSPALLFVPRRDDFDWRALRS